MLKNTIIDYAIIIDDDQIYDHYWVQKMWELREPKLYIAWYCKKWINNYDYWKGSILNYSDNANNEKTHIKYVDYAGPGGCIIDTSIFNKDSPLWNIPDDLPEGVTVYNIDDIFINNNKSRGHYG